MDVRRVPRICAAASLAAWPVASSGVSDGDGACAESRGGGGGMRSLAGAGAASLLLFA
jgi:hypothetical protein